MLAECGGSVSDVARRLSIDPKTVRQHRDVGCKKLGISVARIGRTEQAKQNRRGQADLSAEDDQRIDRTDDGGG